MRPAFIEHVNLTVRNPALTAQLMTDLFGWHIRWEGPAQNGGHTIHVGDERSYLALYTLQGDDTPAALFTKGQPLNHVGLLVDDLDGIEGIEGKVVAAGLKPFSHADYDPGRRFYFFDHDGIEFEIVSYT